MQLNMSICKPKDRNCIRYCIVSGKKALESTRLGTDSDAHSKEYTTRSPSPWRWNPPPLKSPTASATSLQDLKRMGAVGVHVDQEVAPKHQCCYLDRRRRPGPRPHLKDGVYCRYMEYQLSIARGVIACIDDEIQNHKGQVFSSRVCQVASSPQSCIPALAKSSALRIAKLMASNTGKKLIQIDVSSDTVCPWCFVGKKNLEKAMEQTMDKFDFEVRWHPFFLNPDAPKEGVKKSDFYKTKFGPVQFERATARMTEMFRGLGFEYDMSGLTGNTMDSHRLITFAGHQSCEKQNALVEELFVSYFCQGKYIGDKQVLVDAARKVGIEGAEEFLQDPSKGVAEVKEEFSKYSSGISGVPHYVINGKYQLSGGQPSNIFMRAFDMAAKDGAE